MEQIIDKANTVYLKLGSHDLDKVAVDLGAAIYEILDADTLKEAYFADLKVIVLRPGLPQHERRYLLAHALGHHIFHGGPKGNDYLTLHEKGMCGSLDLGRAEISRVEREADVFAAYFLVAETRLNPALKQRWTRESSDPLTELALEFQVPVELMKFRLVYERSRALSRQREALTSKRPDSGAPKPPSAA